MCGAIRLRGADVVKYEENPILVGSVRGSSCDSLVCYCLGITDIGPRGLVDIARHDLPVIEVDPVIHGF